MSDKTNDEKLRILQERLAQIKQKQETPVPTRNQREEVIEIATPQDEVPQKEHNPMSFGWVKSVVIIGVVIGVVGFGSFYAYNNFSNLTSSEEITEEPKEFVLKYNLTLKGNNISIISSFEDENSAKVMVSDLKVKGFKCDYFYLPNKSNSTEELFKVYIGPYENEEESQQWIDNLDVENEISIIHIQTGVSKKKTRSKLAIIKEAEKKRKKEQKEKLAKEKEAKIKKEELQKEKARITKENAIKEEKERERLAEEKLKKEKIEENKIEKEKLAKEIEEKEILNLDKEKLKKEIEELERNKKELIILKNSEIKINYFFEFTNTIENEGYLVISNNAGFPKIQQNFTNISSQGGKENLIKKAKEELENFGVTLDNIYFEKTNSLTLYYPGDIALVYW
ncbi:MAG: SPOR domain-containing protein [Flavobacteriales bacterium]|nr:SPOR domain-containing protein [Flavobacteriales bacterium]